MVNDTSKYIVFNDKKSSDFGVWASGSQIFETPAKRVERISVPGRNGDLIIEDGSFENVELTFKDCFIPNNFAENFSNFKSFLNRQKGYQRLELSWFPDEYRLATFADSISPTIKNWDGRGKFDITFNCKPQRFLKSGEEPIVLMNWTDCSTNKESSTVYYGKSSSSIGIKSGTGHRIYLQKTDASAQNLTVYVTYWNSQDSGVYQDHVTRLQTSTYNVTDTVTIANRTGYMSAEWITIQFITQSDDSLNGWDISIDFIDDDGNPVHGIFADFVNIVNPTGFTTYPLIVSKGKNSNPWTMFFPGIAFSFENEQGDFVEKYRMTVEYKIESETWNGQSIFVDCDNQYIYTRKEDSTTESGYKYYPYAAIEVIDSATGQWMNLTFPALEDKVTRISYPSDESWGTAFDNDDTQPYELIANGDMYKAIYPRWYTI